MQPRPKEPRTIEIPARLRRFFARVAEQIAEGAEEATIESDDLLQCSFCVGGLLEQGGDRFSFEYWSKGDDGPHWELELSAATIAEIAAGRRTTLELFACTDPSCGSMFSSPVAFCVACDRPAVDDAPKLPEGPFQSRTAWIRAFVAANPGLFTDPRRSAAWLILPAYEGSGLALQLGSFASPAEIDAAVRAALADGAAG